jgi:anthranilate synthase component 1
MEIIADLEATPREAYGGGVGYYSWTGDADFAIVIRTATIDESPADASGPGETAVTVRAGAGLVADSDPAAEYEETEQKMDGVLTAIDRIREGDDGEGAADGDADDPLPAGTEADR